MLELISGDETKASPHKPLCKAGQGFAEARIAASGGIMRQPCRSTPGTTTRAFQILYRDLDDAISGPMIHGRKG